MVKLTNHASNMNHKFLFQGYNTKNFLLNHVLQEGMDTWDLYYIKTFFAISFIRACESEYHYLNKNVLSKNSQLYSDEISDYKKFLDSRIREESLQDISQELHHAWSPIMNAYKGIYFKRMEVKNLKEVENTLLTHLPVLNSNRDSINWFDYSNYRIDHDFLEERKTIYSSISQNENNVNHLSGFRFVMTRIVNPSSRINESDYKGYTTQYHSSVKHAYDYHQSFKADQTDRNFFINRTIPESEYSTRTFDSVREEIIEYRGIFNSSVNEVDSILELDSNDAFIDFLH